MSSAPPLATRSTRPGCPLPGRRCWSYAEGPTPKWQARGLNAELELQTAELLRLSRKPLTWLTSRRGAGGYRDCRGSALGGASRIGASDLQPGLALVWNLSSRWGFRIQRIGPCPIPRGLPTPAAVQFSRALRGQHEHHHTSDHHRTSACSGRRRLLRPGTLVLG